MAKKATAATKPALRTVSAERAARLYCLLKLLATGPQTRAMLKRRLHLDVRGFYRDLEALREAGIAVRLDKGRYSFVEDLQEGLACLPFPDPRLTLGEALQLAKGRSRAHRKLKEQVAAIIDPG